MEPSAFTMFRRSHQQTDFYGVKFTVGLCTGLFHDPHNCSGMKLHALPFHRGGRLSLRKAKWLAKVTEATRLGETEWWPTWAQTHMA